MLHDLNECMNQTRNMIDRLVDVNNTIIKYDEMQSQYKVLTGLDSSSFAFNQSIFKDILEQHKDELIIKIVNLKKIVDICLTGLRADDKLDQSASD